MNTTSMTVSRAQSRIAIAWKVTLILIPLVTLGLLLWLRNLEVTALRQRTVSSYGTVPPFQLVPPVYNRTTRLGTRALRDRICQISCANKRHRGCAFCIEIIYFLGNRVFVR